MNSVTRKFLCGVLVVVAVPVALRAALPPGNEPAPTVVVPTTPAPGPGARIVFQTPIYDFGKVNSGEVVKATFVFTNAAEDEVLKISAVQPGCGCTTAGEWSREVQPGKTGTIPIEFRSTGFGGPVSKTITVVSNDKTHPTTVLQLKGTIWKPIDVTPPYAVLNVTPESTGANVTVAITNNTEQPVTLSAPEVNNAAFSVQLKTNEPGKSFLLTVSTTATNTGNVQGQITLRTSSTNMPVINITAWANIQPVISVIPPTISLPQAPLANRLTPIITLINNTTNQVTFSDAKVTVDGVDLQFKEVQAGRYFTATLVFPQGFELAPGKPAEFVIKSTHPRLPVIRVPINQPPKPPVTQHAVVNPTPPAVPPSPATPPAPAARPPHVMPRPSTAAMVPPIPPTPSSPR